MTSKKGARSRSAFAAGGAVVAIAASAAAFFGNIEAIVTKPRKIAESIGVIKLPPVAVQVSLASLNEKQITKLALSEDMGGYEDFLKFQEYGILDGTFCLPKGAVANCISNVRRTQGPSQTIGYTSEDSFWGPFAPAIPVFDIVSVRPDERDILLTKLRIEYELTTLDRTPYIQVIGLDDDEGQIELVNHSQEELKSVRLTFNVRDLIPSEDVDAWVRSHPPRSSGTFDGSINLTKGELFGRLNANPSGESFLEGRMQTVDVRKHILARFPGSRFEKYTWFDPPVDNVRLVGVNSSWSSAPAKKLDEFDQNSRKKNLTVIVEGELTATSRSGNVYRSSFITPVIVSTEKGYGAGAVAVDSTAAFVIPDRDRGSVSKPVKLVLTDQSPSVRSIAALVFQRSGEYRVRFVYDTNEKRGFMASNWSAVRAFVSPFFVSYYNGELTNRAFDE